MSHVVIAGVALVGSVEQRLVAVGIVLLEEFVVAGADAANPAALAPQLEVHHAVVERTAASLLVEHLHLDEHHVGAVGHHALRVLDGGEAQLCGLAGGLQLVARRFLAVGIGHGLQGSGLELHVAEGEEPLPPALTLAHRLAVDEQLDLVAC